MIKKSKTLDKLRIFAKESYLAAGLSRKSYERNHHRDTTSLYDYPKTNQFYPDRAI